LRVELTLEEALELFKEKKLTVMVNDGTLEWADRNQDDFVNGEVRGFKVPYGSWTFERDLIVDSNS